MKTLVFEQWQGGHYFNYLKCLVPKISELSDEVVVAMTAAAYENPSFEHHREYFRKLDNVSFDFDSKPINSKSAILNRLRIGKNLIDAIERSNPEFVFIPSADEHILTLPFGRLLTSKSKWRQETHVEAVVHYRSYTLVKTPRDRIVSGAQRLLLNTGAISHINFVNFLQFEAAVAQDLTLSRHARVAGDPVPSYPRVERLAARSSLGLATDGRWLGMIGGLDERKAVASTLAAFRAACLPKSCRFLLAGKLVETYATLIRSDYSDLLRDGSLVVLDRYLTDDELAECFAALDLHCSVYVAFDGLSSLMLKSLAAGVPVLVSDQPGWSRAVVRRFDVGRAVDHSNTQSFASVLRTYFGDECGSYRQSEAVDRLLQFHSVENFTDGVTERLSRKLGSPMACSTLNWQWVLDALPECKRTAT